MVIPDENFEKRCRYRLEQNGMRMRKVNFDGNPFYYLYDIGGDDTRPDDDDPYSWFSPDDLLEYCGELELKNAEQRAYPSF